MRGALVAVAGLALSVVLAPRAHAYRTFRDDPAVAALARWPEQTVTWELSTAELDGRLPPDEVQRAAAAAFSAWESVPCARIDAQTSAVTSEPAAPGDGRNSIAFVSSDWIGRGFPSGRGATTDVQMRRTDDGTVEIVEADIYVNIGSYRFVLGGPAPGELDLQSVLTHEIGHLLGLLHPCELGGTAGAPDCASDTALAESSMYPVYIDELARSLATDDIDGICAIYPPAPAECIETCPAGTACVDGACTPDECADGRCEMCGGQPCEPELCLADATCVSGACAVLGPAEGYCVTSGDFGTRCEAAHACSSRLCLTSASAGAFCTISCTTDEACPDDMYCASVSDRPVCAPRASSTCSASRAAPAPAGVFAAFMFLLAIRASTRVRQGLRCV